MIDEKILLVGPSSDIKNFNKDYFLKAREDKFLIVSYSDSLGHFLNIKFYPDFWSFIDPFTIARYLKEIKQHELKNVSLLINNLYKNKFKNFYEAGFTCNALKKTGVFNEVEKLNFDLFFNKVYRLEYKIMHYSENIPDNLNLRSSNYLFASTKKDTNICKFSHYILPTIIYFFKNVKEVKVIGFGQYDSPRFICSKNKKGYNDYIKTFNIIKSLILKNLRNKIKLSFDGAPSFFEKLQT
jgi:hypothetical protein